MWFSGQLLIIQSATGTALWARSCRSKMNLQWLQLKPEAIYISSQAESLYVPDWAFFFFFFKANMLDLIGALVWAPWLRVKGEMRGQQYDLLSLYSNTNLYYYIYIYIYDPLRTSTVNYKVQCECLAPVRVLIGVIRFPYWGQLRAIRLRKQWPAMFVQYMQGLQPSAGRE